MKNNLRAGVAELARLVALQQPREAEWHIQLGDAWLAGGEPVKGSGGVRTGSPTETAIGAGAAVAGEGH